MFDLTKCFYAYVYCIFNTYVIFHSELESLVLSICVATINDGGNKELGVVLGCENSKILLYTLKGKLVKKIEYHKGPITAVQLTSQDVLITGTYKIQNTYFLLYLLIIINFQNIVYTILKCNTYSFKTSHCKITMVNGKI